jgi:hypothetical protein
MVAVNAIPFANRFRIEKEIKSLGIRNGDIFIRETDTRGPFNIPFSKLVSTLTNSNFSHASLARVEGDEVYLLEVNDRGIVKERLIDWLDYCVGEAVFVYRPTNPPADFDARVSAEIDRFFQEDFMYNFMYTNANGLYYCTQAICTVYNACGITLMEPVPMQSVLTGWRYFLFKIINSIVVMTSGKGFNTNDKFYFVGNQSAGILASPHIAPIYKHTGALKLRAAI